MKKNKVFIFHGMDYKVGTTMIAQSVAQQIAKQRKDLKVLFIGLNSRESTEYVREEVQTIESMKMRVDNHMLKSEDVMKICKKEGNLYVIGGMRNALDHRHYSEKFSLSVLEVIRDSFDLLIVDSGNEIDSGLGIGSLKGGDKIFLVLMQNETSLTRYQRFLSLYEKIDIVFDFFIVNKFMKDDPYDLSYLQKRLLVPKSRLFTVKNEPDYGRYAEMDHNTLLEYKSHDYKNGICKISNEIFSQGGYEEKIGEEKNEGIRKILFG